MQKIEHSTGGLRRKSVGVSVCMCVRVSAAAAAAVAYVPRSALVVILVQAVKLWHIGMQLIFKAFPALSQRRQMHFTALGVDRRTLKIAIASCMHK